MTELELFLSWLKRQKDEHTGHYSISHVLFDKDNKDGTVVELWTAGEEELIEFEFDDKGKFIRFT